MTSYSDLVNYKVGNATNYGSNLKFTMAQRCEASKALMSRKRKSESLQFIRVYSSSKGYQLKNFQAGKHLI
jgi:hypothetical protein